MSEENTHDNLDDNDDDDLSSFFGDLEGFEVVDELESSDEEEPTAKGSDIEQDSEEKSPPKSDGTTVESTIIAEKDVIVTASTSGMTVDVSTVVKRLPRPAETFTKIDETPSKSETKTTISNERTAVEDGKTPQIAKSLQMVSASVTKKPETPEVENLATTAKTTLAGKVETPKTAQTLACKTAPDPDCKADKADAMKSTPVNVKSVITVEKTSIKVKTAPSNVKTPASSKTTLATAKTTPALTKTIPTTEKPSPTIVRKVASTKATPGTVKKQTAGKTTPTMVRKMPITVTQTSGDLKVGSTITTEASAMAKDVSGIKTVSVNSQKGFVERSNTQDTAVNNKTLSSNTDASKNKSSSIQKTGRTESPTVTTKVASSPLKPSPTPNLISVMEKTVQTTKIVPGQPNSASVVGKSPVAATSVVKKTPVAMKSTPPAVKTTPSAVATVAMKTTPSAVKSTPSAVKSTPSAVKSTPSAAKTTPSAAKTTPSAVKSAPSSLKSTPIAMKLIVAAMTTPSAAKSTPTTAKANLSATKTAPSTVKASPSAVKTNPLATKTTPSAAKSAPSIVKASPSAVIATPLATKTTPVATKSTPSAAKATPAAKTTPSMAKASPSAVKTTPSAMKTTPSAAKSAPSIAKASPSAVKTTPLATKTTPSAAKTTPSIAKASPSAVKTTPSALKTTPSVAKAAPSAAKTTPSAAKAAPSAANTTPSMAKASPSAVKTTPLATKTTPSAAKTTPSIAKASPSAVKTTPSALKTTPSAAKAAPSAAKTTPSAAKAAPSAANTTPSMAKASPSAVKTTPSALKTTPAAKSVPSMAKASPSAVVTTSLATKTAPSAAKTTPSAAKTTPLLAKPSPSAVKTAPSALKTTPSAANTTSNTKATPVMKASLSTVGTTPSAAKTVSSGLKASLETTSSSVSKSPSALTATPATVNKIPSVEETSSNKKETPLTGEDVSVQTIDVIQKASAGEIKISDGAQNNSVATKNIVLSSKPDTSDAVKPITLKQTPVNKKSLDAMMLPSVKLMPITNIAMSPSQTSAKSNSKDSANSKTNSGIMATPHSNLQHIPEKQISSESSEHEEEQQSESTTNLVESSESSDFSNSEPDEPAVTTSRKPGQSSTKKSLSQSSLESIDSKQSSSHDTELASDKLSSKSVLMLRKAFVKIVPLSPNITTVTLTPTHPLLKPVKRRISNEYDEAHSFIPPKRTLLMEECSAEVDKKTSGKQIVTSKSEKESSSAPVKPYKVTPVTKKNLEESTSGSSESGSWPTAKVSNMSPSENLVQKAVAVFKKVVTNKVLSGSVGNLQILSGDKNTQKVVSTPSVSTASPKVTLVKKMSASQTKGNSSPANAPNPQTRVDVPQTKAPAALQIAKASSNVVLKQAQEGAGRVVRTTLPKSNVAMNQNQGGTVSVVRTPTGKLIVKRRIIRRSTKETMTDCIMTRSSRTQTPGGVNTKFVNDDDIIQKRMAEKHGRQSVNRLKTVMIHPVLPQDMADPVLQPYFQKCHCMSARFLGSNKKDLIKKGHLEIRFFSEADAKIYVEEMQGLKLASGKYVSAKILGQCGPWDGTLDDWQKMKQAEYEGLCNARCVYVHNIPPGTDETMLKLLYPDAIAVSIQLPKEDDKLSKGHALLEFPDAEEAENVTKESKNYQTRIGDNILSLFFIGKKSLKTEEAAANEQSIEKTPVEIKPKTPVAQKRTANAKDSHVQPPVKKIKSEVVVQDKPKDINCAGTDIKQLLYIWSQTLNRTPRYTYKSAGSPYKKIFRSECTVPGYTYIGRGNGRSKRMAQNKAAYDFVMFLVDENIIVESCVRKFKKALIAQGVIPDDSTPPKPKVSRPSRSKSPEQEGHKRLSKREEFDKTKDRKREKEAVDRRRSNETNVRSTKTDTKDRRMENEVKYEAKDRTENETIERRRYYESLERRKLLRKQEIRRREDKAKREDSKLENRKTEKRRERSHSMERKSRESESQRRSADRQKHKSSLSPVFKAPDYKSSVYRSSEKASSNSPHRESLKKGIDFQNITALKDEIEKQLAELEEGRVTDTERMSFLAKTLRTSSVMRGKHHESRKRAGIEKKLKLQIKASKLENRREVIIPELDMLDADESELDKTESLEPSSLSTSEVSYYKPPFQYDLLDNQLSVNSQPMSISRQNVQIPSATTDQRSWISQQVEPIREPGTNTPYSHPRSTATYPDKSTEYAISTLYASQQEKSFYRDQQSLSLDTMSTYQPVKTTRENLTQIYPMEMAEKFSKKSSTRGSLIQIQPIETTNTSSHQSHPMGVAENWLNLPMRMHSEFKADISNKSSQSSNLISLSDFNRGDTNQSLATNVSTTNLVSNPPTVANQEILKQQLINHLRQFQEGQLSDESNILTQLAQQLLRIQRQEETGPQQDRSQSLPMTSTQATASNTGQETSPVQSEETSEHGADSNLHAKIRENLLLRLQTAGINSGTISSLVKGLKQVQSEQKKESKEQPLKREETPISKQKFEQSKQRVQAQLKQKIHQIKLNQMALKVASKTQAAVHISAAQKLAIETALSLNRQSEVVPTSSLNEDKFDMPSEHTSWRLTTMGHRKGPVGLSRLQSGKRGPFSSSRQSGSSPSQSQRGKSQFKTPRPISRSRTRSAQSNRMTSISKDGGSSTPALVQYPHLDIYTSYNKSPSPTTASLVDYPTSP